jgi:hypothetical protein
MGPVGPFLAEITRVALAAAQRHRFALGGGHALVLYGVVDRPTADVDLFTDHDGPVRGAADLVRAALTAAGFTAVEVERDSDLDGVVDGLTDLMIDRGRPRRPGRPPQPVVPAPGAQSGDHGDRSGHAHRRPDRLEGRRDHQPAGGA